MIFQLLSLSIFLIYIGYVLIKYGMQESISDSWYRISLSDKWIFTLATWGYTIPLVISGLNGNTYQDLLLLSAGILLGLVGVFPDFKVVRQRPFHVIGAEGGIAVGVVWVLTTPFWYVMIPVVASIYYLFKKKPVNHTWWIEVIAYMSILLSIFLNTH